MENDIRPREGLLEPVLPGSAIFDESILPPLHNSYLYEESRKSFIYTSAHLINNDILQKKYAAFRIEKRESGYTDEELEESFGFLLFEDESKANKLGDGGLLTGHSSCSTLGDPSKGVYVSKYSDCLDVKRWYCGKSGHIAIVRLTKGRVKEVSDNYTVNFTAPTKGFDCHESDQLTAVTATTSSFLAFERTQHYLYELINGGKDTEKCPRHVCPFAVVTFSYGKAEPSVPESSEKSEEKTVFSYQPWIGQLVVDTLVYEIGLKSSNGALLPAQLPKTLRIKTVIRVSDLRMLLPKEIFETCFSGEVMVGGRCCTLYEVVSTDADDSLLSNLTEELKEKDIALVFQLGDDGFFVLLHSSYFLSYEDANSEKAEALQGMFIFSDSRTIQRDTKSCRRKSPLSSDILQVLPALNYAETEMEKSGLGQHEKIRIQLEKHLEHYGTLIHPGLQSSPQREASMFPDQYDLPYVFKHLFPTPKWTEATRSQLQSYMGQPHCFEFPVKRATELLLAGREQRRDDPDDEVYYCISSPEEASRSPTNVWLEKPLEAEASCSPDLSEGIQSTAEILSNSCVTTPTESKHSDHSGLSKECNAEIVNKESSPALKTSPTTLEVDNGKTEVSMEITQAAAVVVTPEVLTPPLPKESAIVNSCDDQTAQVSSPAQEVMVNESTLPIPKMSTLLEASEVKFCRTEPDVPLDPEIENKAPAQTDWRSLPRRRGRKRKRISKTSTSKIKINQSLHSSSLSPSIATEATEVQCMGDKQNEPDTEMDQSSQQKLNIEDKPIVGLIELLSSNSAPSECLENSHSQSQERVENQSFEGETPPKTAWKSLPRRCRKDQDSPTSVPQKDSKEVSEDSCKETLQIHPLKRKIECLRYGLKTIITDCGRIFVPHGQEVPNKDLELVKKRQQVDDEDSGLRKTELEAERLISSQSSDKADSVGVGETVNAEVEPKEMAAKEDSPSLTKEIGPASNHSEESPEESLVQALDRQSSSCQSEQTSLTIHEQHKTGNESSSEIKTAVDEAKLTELENIKESGSSEPSHKKKKRNTEYTIISISQLRTVLRRGKKDSGSTAEKAKEAESEPNLKKGQGDDDKNNDDHKSNCDSVSQGQPDQANSTIPATEESECLQPNQKPQNLPSVEEKPSAKNYVESSMELSKDLNKDAQVMHLSSDENVPLPKKVTTNRKKRGNPPRKWYKRKAKDITKENECLTPLPHNTEQLKPDQSRTASDIPSGHESEELFVGSDKKSCSLEGVVNAAPVPADALTLLADLALSDNGGQNEKTLQNLGLDTDGRLNQRQGMQDSVKESGSQEAISVLHALLRRPADDTLKLPIAARSPLPSGLVMRGEWVVVISKDHSYSQPPSLLLGLSGTHPQALPFQRTGYLIKPNPVDLHGRPLSSKEDWVLLQRESCVNRNGWEQQPLIKKQLTSITKEKRRTKRRRQIVEKDGSVEVTRVWREQYDFSLDSKFTNDPHDKAVTRALHGPWNLSIVDSPEEVHLIFHMWIGLFYSRSPSRFFHFDPIGRILQVGGNLPVETDLNSTAGFSESNQVKVSSQLNNSLVSSALPSEPGVLNTSDETRKTSVPSSEVLDLSVKGCEPLDLTSVNIKTRETSIEKHDPLSLDSPMSEMKSQLVSTSTDFQFKISNLADSSGSVKRDNICVHGIHENASYIKSSNNCASGSSDGHVNKASNVWSDVQNSSDVQRRGTKELAHVDSSAFVVQCNSSHEMNTKEDTISSQVHYSLSAKSLSPKQTPNSFACEKSETVPIDYDSNAPSSHEMAIKRHGHEPLKGNMNCSVEVAVSFPTDTNSLAQRTVAVIVGNDSKIETIMQDQNNSEADTISVVQGLSNFRVEKDVEVDDQNNSKAETIATELDMTSFNDDSMTGQNRSDSKTETTIIMQGSPALKESVILDVQCPGGSKDKMVYEQNVSCTDSIMTVHNLNDASSDAIMVMGDPGDSEGEREVITYKPKDAKVDSVVARQHQADSEIEEMALLEHVSKPDSDPAISEQNQNRAESETSERMQCSEDYEIQPDIPVKNQNEAKPEAAVASLATKDSEVQSVITEQTHSETKLETTVTVQAHTDSENKAVVDMNQNDSKPKELAEGEHGNTEGETQAVEMELDDMNTEASISEENNRYSKDASVMDLKENSIKINRETEFSANKYEHNVPMDTQMDCNLECERSTAGSECLADTSMEDVEKIDNQHMEYEMLPKVATGKAEDHKSSHEGNMNKDLSIMEQNEQINQSRGMVGETEDKSSAEIAEKLPHDLAQQQKTSKEVVQEAVLTSSQVAHNPRCTTEGHELKDTENGMRCPTPTVDELPYIISTGCEPSRCSTPTQDELPSDFGSAGGEKKCHESCSDPYDKSVYNTEGMDLAALSHMIAWFRKEQNNKRELESVPSQNSGPVQLKLSANSESRAKGHRTYPDNSSQLISSKELSGCASGCIESDNQNTESSKDQCKDGPVTDQSEDLMPVLPNRCTADEYHAVDSDTRDSKSVENLSLCTLSEGASYASTHANAGKDRKEKQLKMYQEEEILDTESVSSAIMKAKQQERAYLKDIYSNKHKHSTGSYCPQRRNPGYTDNLNQTWQEEEHHDALHYGVDSQFLDYDHMEESRQSSSTSSLESSSCTESFMNYGKGEGLRVTVDFKRDYTLSGHESHIITALDDGDMQMTCKNYPRIAMHSRTIQNPCHKGTQRYVEKFLQKWDALHQTDDDITQSSLDLEYLVFSEKMNHILKRNSKGQQTRNDTCRSPVTIQFSRLNEKDASEELCDALPTFSESTIKVTLADRKEKREEDSRHMPLRLQRLSCKRESEAARSNISAITAEFAESYYAMMNDVCTNKAAVRKTDRIKKQQDSPKLKMTKPVELSGKMREDLFERLHYGLNSVVRQACKTKYRFFILMTSDDPFFRETKDLLENEGHIHVEPDQFDLETDGPASPLLIILRNEDISSHICEVPHLLELKKSSSVLFAGIDQPDDFVNLTHQELFGKGGFVVFDGTALNKLTLENMKKIVVFLEKLSKKGKWKWFLHYRDSRRFRENARSQKDVQDRKHFLDCCQDAGIVDVLPYHECDVISKDQPNYLHCLVRLQVQNASTRYPVFVTDSPDKTFERNGILTMNMNTFLQILSNDSCTIS